MVRVELREREEKRRPITVYKVPVSYEAKPAFQELVDRGLSGSNVKLTVSPPGIPFMQALSEVVPEIWLDIRLKHPVKFRPDNNGTPPVRPANVREIGLVLSGLTSSHIDLDDGKKKTSFSQITLWIGTVPGYISTGLTGGANYIVEDILVKRRKEGGLLRIKASEDAESGGVRMRRKLEMMLTRRGEHAMFEYKQGSPTPISR